MITEILLFTQKNCPNCPTAKAVVSEAIQEAGNHVNIKEVDLNRVSIDLEFELFSNMIVLRSAPSIVARKQDGTLEMWFSSLPRFEDVMTKLGDDDDYISRDARTI